MFSDGFPAIHGSAQVAHENCHQYSTCQTNIQGGSGGQGSPAATGCFSKWCFSAGPGWEHMGRAIWAHAVVGRILASPDCIHTDDLII